MPAPPGFSYDTIATLTWNPDLVVTTLPDARRTFRQAYVALRTGLRSDAFKELAFPAGWTAGVGLKAWGQEFDYALVPFGALGQAHYFSLLLTFGPSGGRPSGAGEVLR